ncbi:hypothetical protein FIBSPDRAFT_896033 [Athelia psychrophila]|uniref:Uncharacterized protein n=1 Tax=Athelia psychrophila TaxID=1759441 RepID=A0A166DW60_9AGAM|nr:hypothetical protein FIBSPDRAFT_896033 [Fibularhizoctonia sp. CBS 109695]
MWRDAPYGMQPGQASPIGPVQRNVARCGVRKQPVPGATGAAQTDQYGKCGVPGAAGATQTDQYSKCSTMWRSCAGRAWRRAWASKLKTAQTDRYSEMRRNMAPVCSPCLAQPEQPKRTSTANAAQCGARVQAVPGDPQEPPARNGRGNPPSFLPRTLLCQTMLRLDLPWPTCRVGVDESVIAATSLGATDVVGCIRVGMCGGSDSLNNHLA